MYHLTIPHIPELNGVAEHMNRTLTEKICTIIIGANLNKVFRGRAVSAAAHSANLTPSEALKNDITSYEIWHGKKQCLISRAI